MSSTKRKFFLVDCNNFFVSCERAFQPALENKRVVVLSSNDGCVVARSNEAKRLGIPMGAPAFKYKSALASCTLFSSNFNLYSDMSLRVIEVLKTFTDQIEIYSIDEAFLCFDHDKDLETIAAEIQKKVRQWTGIPVSIGIANTKTLAKMANKLAKKNNGIFSFIGKTADSILQTFPIEEIWNVGRSLQTFLKQRGIAYALDFIKMDPLLLQKHYGINGLKTLLELKGIPCIQLEQIKATRKSLVCSRSFGKPVQSFHELLNAINTFVAKAAYKLRMEAITSSHMTLFTCQSHAVKAILPSNHTFELLSHTKQMVRSFFCPTSIYKKAGVMLCNFQNQNREDLFLNAKKEELKAHLSQTVDQINQQKKSSIFFASQGIKATWKPLCQKKSRAYTTSFDHLLEVS